jgi:hypothetical protein
VISSISIVRVENKNVLKEASNHRRQAGQNGHHRPVVPTLGQLGNEGRGLSGELFQGRARRNGIVEGRRRSEVRPFQDELARLWRNVDHPTRQLGELREFLAVSLRSYGEESLLDVIDGPLGRARPSTRVQDGANLRAREPTLHEEEGQPFVEKRPRRALLPQNGPGISNGQGPTRFQKDPEHRIRCPSKAERIL